MFLILDKRTNFICDIVDEVDLVEENDQKWIRLNNGKLITFEIVNVHEIEAEQIPENKKYYHNGKFSNKDWNEYCKLTEETLRRLQELDVIVPRIVEDIVEQGEFTLHQSKLDIILAKQALRALLQNL